MPPAGSAPPATGSVASGIQLQRRYLNCRPTPQEQPRGSGLRLTSGHRRHLTGSLPPGPPAVGSAGHRRALSLVAITWRWRCGGYWPGRWGDADVQPRGPPHRARSTGWACSRTTATAAPSTPPPTLRRSRAAASSSSNRLTDAALRGGDESSPYWLGRRLGQPLHLAHRRPLEAAAQRLYGEALGRAGGPPTSA